MIRILIELEGSDEPAWAWLEYQHAHIIERTKSIAQKAQDAVKSRFTIESELMIAANSKAMQIPSTSTAYTDLLKRQIDQPVYVLSDLHRESYRTIETDVSLTCRISMACNPKSCQAII
jgi:exocyst complex component 2